MFWFQFAQFNIIWKMTANVWKAGRKRTVLNVRVHIPLINPFLHVTPVIVIESARLYKQSTVITCEYRRRVTFRTSTPHWNIHYIIRNVYTWVSTASVWSLPFPPYPLACSFWLASCTPFSRDTSCRILMVDQCSSTCWKSPCNGFSHCNTMFMI